MTPNRLRVLFLASYFPKPDNPLMGTWALAQAQALARQPIDLQVVSFTSWVPKVAAKTSGARAYADCPEEYLWPGSVPVRYPRWLYYPISPIKDWSYRNPEPYLQLAWWSARTELCRIIDRFQPDVIFCHHLLPNGWIAAQLPPPWRRPLVTLDHDFDEITDCWKYPRRKAAMEVATTHAKVSLTVSRRMEQDLRSLFPRQRILTHSIGVHLPPPELARRERPLKLMDKTIVLTCALFAERKGIPLLIEAFCRIAPNYPQAILRIIGAGPEEEKVRAAIQHHDSTHQVQLLGKKPHQEVLQEMAWADCFALVGWDEPFGAVYLEAMAAGKPILCCEDGGINDVFRHEVHGYAVAPKSVSEAAAALDRLLSHDSERIEMGQNARQLVHNHLTWDAKAAELVELLKQATTDS